MSCFETDSDSLPIRVLEKDPIFDKRDVRYSHNMAPCDLFLFLRMKRCMERHWFDNIEEVKKKPKEELSGFFNDD